MNSSKREVLASAWRWHFHWEPADCWIGLYWRRKIADAMIVAGPLDHLYGIETLDPYICVLPLIPLHAQRRRLLAPLGAKSWDAATVATPVADLRALQDRVKLPRTVEELRALRDDTNPARLRDREN